MSASTVKPTRDDTIAGLVERIYGAATDEDIYTLDAVMIRAGLLWRCAAWVAIPNTRLSADCHTLNPTTRATCQSCGNKANTVKAS